jgi:hypothetical protein
LSALLHLVHPKIPPRAEASIVVSAAVLATSAAENVNPLSKRPNLAKLAEATLN